MVVASWIQGLLNYFDLLNSIYSNGCVVRNTNIWELILNYQKINVKGC